MAEKASRRRGLHLMLWVAGGALGILLLVGLGLSLYFTPERLRALIVPRLEESLQRQVALKRVGLSLWGGIEASVEGLTVSERSGFGEVPFVEADRAALSLRFWPLLRGQAELGEIAVVHPKFSVVVDERGEANYADIGKQKGAPEPAARPRGRVGFPVDRMVVSGGSLRYENRQSGSVTRVEGIDYRLRLGLSEGRIGLDGDLSVLEVSVQPRDGEGMRMGAVRLSHRFFVEEGGDRLAVESLQVMAGPVALEVKGEVRDLSGTPTLSLEVENREIDVGRFAAYLREAGVMPKDGTAQGSAELWARIEGPWRPDEEPPVYPEVSGKVSLRGVRIEDPSLLVPVEGGEAEIEMEKGIVRLGVLKARAGRSDISITGRVEGALMWAMTPGGKAPPRPFLAVDLTSRVLDLDEMLPVIPPTAALPGNGGGQWGLATSAYCASTQPPDETSPTLWLIRTADVKGTLRFGEMVSGGVSYREFRSEVRAKNRVLRLNKVRAKVYGGEMQAQVEVDARPDRGGVPVRASVSVDSVQANGLIQEYLKWRLPIYGRMGLSLTMSGRADSTLELVEKEIRAEGTANINEGKVANWAMLKEAASGVSQLGFLNFDEIPLRSLRAPFRVADGRIYLDEVKVKAADMACRLNGSTGMDGSLDYALDVDLPASRLNVGGVNLGQALGSFFGGGSNATLPLRIRIGGTTERPQVEADLQPGRREQVKGKTEEKLKEKGKGLLKKFF